jgi:hypothetical protein
MPIELKLRDSARIALAISAAFPLGSYAATAGRVDFAVGGVSALRTADGQPRPLTRGSDINSGETIDTGEGRAQLRFTDGSQVSLQPRTQYRIDDYKFSGKNDGEEKGFFSLVKGGFRTITGLIGKADRKAYQVSTTTATIGIRGTEFAVVSSQNGVTISAGEGLVEVCNGAGCIILASGESAVVTDKDGKPVRVSTKGSDSTNSKPATPTIKIDYSKSDEGLAAILPSLPSGPGYAMAMAGQRTFDGGESTETQSFITSHLPGAATFSGSDLARFVVDGGEGGSGSYTATAIAGGFTDGIIGWGRWTAGADTNHIAGGTSSGDNALNNAHYIVGKPTSSADMTALSNANLIGTYALMGYTLPTAYSPSTGVTTGSGGITGSLTADFNGGTVGYNLNNISVGGATYGISGSASVSGAKFSDSGGTVTGGGGSAGGLGVEGFFVGANAVRAGLVYQFLDSTKTISGAAAFRQTGLAPGGIVY